MADSKAVKGWRNVDVDGWVNVIPTHDDKFHFATAHDLIHVNGMACVCGGCSPKIDYGLQMVLHNAYDFREVAEFLSGNPKV